MRDKEIETIRIYKSLKGFSMKERRVGDKIQSFQKMDNISAGCNANKNDPIEKMMV